MVESMLRVGSFISSRGDSKADVAMDCWKSLVVDMGSAIADAGGVTYDGALLMVGKVCRLGRESAGARDGRRGVWDEMLGLGPQLETGEKNGDVGLRRSGENVEGIVASVK